MCALAVRLLHTEALAAALSNDEQCVSALVTQDGLVPDGSRTADHSKEFQRGLRLAETCSSYLEASN